MEEVQTKLAEFTKELRDEASREPEAQPIDVYQAIKNDRYEKSKKAKSYGSPASLKQVAEAMVDDLSIEYNFTLNQYNHMMEYNMPDSAKAMMDSYMENDFLPVVMGLVDQYGADAVLMNQQVITMLDEKALTGNGDGTGYTAAFIKTFAPEAQGVVASGTDAALAAEIDKLRGMADEGWERGAASLAKRLKEQVDNGMYSASQNDYAILARVSSYK